MTTSKYLLFLDVTPQDANRKTRIVSVRSRRSGGELGEIRWYGAWRQYTFWPAELTIWNRECLNDVNAAITELMDARQSIAANDVDDTRSSSSSRSS